MQRKKGTLTPTEVTILAVGLGLRAAGAHSFHGFRLAQEMKDRDAAGRAPAYGTLYRALDRMADSGFLESEWEDPEIAAEFGRPRRRFYQVTAAGEAALARAAGTPGSTVGNLRTGLAGS